MRVRSKDRGASVKLALKIVGGLVLLLVVTTASYVGYISATWEHDYSDTEKPAIKASQDPEVIKRGEYIVHSVAHCSSCHVSSDVTAARAPGEHPSMAGGLEWKMGPMGQLRSPNITPDTETGIGSWTDEELARAIKWSVGRDGKLLMFMSLAMPALADEDVQAVVSYLRSTPPAKRANKPHELGLFFKWLGSRLSPGFRKPFLDGLKYAPPSAEPSLARGEYLARGPGWCVGCHTQFDLMSMKLAGAEFSGSDNPEPDKDDRDMVFRMPNLTPDPETGHMFSWDEEHFVSRFRAGRAIKNSKMPWEAYREMTDSDLRSVFRFLKATPPSKHYIGPTFRKAAEDPTKDRPQGATAMGG
jgi:mono/diheme cytochrome c family protein